ncbi:hypothetical protein [Mycolicibacterium celeriflavum]|uniref:hypothetical protein n=1 Tax=Mycolicibacterium celeriflavum TaxID=1249101 RepID=UPI003CED14B7
MSTSSGALAEKLSLRSPAGVDAGEAAPVLDSLGESVAEFFAEESAEDRSAEVFSVRLVDSRDIRPVDESRVERVSDESRVAFVVDRPEPNVVRGFVLDAVDPPVESESVCAVDEEFVVPAAVLAEPADAPVEPDDELAELAESDEELEDDCPPSSANAVPIPAVPTNPATPSEKATAPTRSATLAK